MKTTLVIPDAVMARVRKEARARGMTISELVEAALRLVLDDRPPRKKLPPLPTHRSGGLLVDISDREALHRAMEGD